MNTENQKKILLVDDDADIINLMKTILEKEGYSISIASDGDEALQLIESSKPDLVLMDVNMPKIDGYHACFQIKSTTATENLPIILVSVNTQGYQILKGQLTGADAYLTKPFSKEKLLDLVNEQLNKNEASKIS